MKIITYISITMLLLCLISYSDANLDSCKTSCNGKCVLTSQNKYECQKTGFFENLFNKITSIFQKPKKVNSNEIKNLTKENKENIEKKAWENLLKDKANHETKTNLYNLIENANMSDLFNLKMMIDHYCYVRERKGYNSNCNELYAKLKKKADELKDKEFNAIKEDNPDMVNKLIQLQAFLMAQRNADGTDSIFSKENVNKVNKETKKLMKKRFERILKQENISLLLQEFIFLKAHESASGEEKENDDFGLFGKGLNNMTNELKEKIKKEIQKLVFKIDKCNPDKKEVEKLKKVLIDVCAIREIIQQKICYEIINGNINLIYDWAGYEKDCNQNNKSKQNNKSTNIEQQILIEKIHNLTKINYDNLNITKIINYTYSEENKNTNISNLENNITTIEQRENQNNNNYENNITNAVYDNNILKEINDIIPHENEVINFYEDPIIGWDYESNLETEQVDECIIRCGFEPPLQILEQGLCYNKMIFEEEPCHILPMIPEDVQECTKYCLQDIMIE